MELAFTYQRGKSDGQHMLERNPKAIKQAKADRALMERLYK